MRTVPIPAWVKVTVDAWLKSANLASGESRASCLCSPCSAEYLLNLAVPIRRFASLGCTHECAGGGLVVGQQMQIVHRG